MRRPRRFAFAAVAFLAVALGLLAVDTICGVQALGKFMVRVTGRFVDDTSGQPIVGLSVLTLPDASYADDAAWVAEEREYHANENGLPFELTAAGASALDGAIDLRVHVSWCRHIGPISGLFERELPAYRGINALLAEKEGYARTVIDCTKARWTAHEGVEPGDPHATLELGEIRMRRTP